MAFDTDLNDNRLNVNDGYTDEELGQERPQITAPQEYLDATLPDDAEEGAKPDFAAAEIAFLADIRKEYAADTGEDTENREAALEDLEFLVGNQWDKELEEKRQSGGKPTLTINRLIAFVGQVLGSRRLNQAAVKVLPDNGGTKEIARVRQGLIRSIEKLSRASFAYNTAHLNQVACGDGAFQVGLVYAEDDVFEQDIRIEHIPNAMSVVWDRMATEPTGKDASHVFVEDNLTEKDFKKLWPEAKVQDFATDMTANDARTSGWFDEQTVRVVTYWRTGAEMRTLILTTEGATEDVTGKPIEQWQARVQVHPQTRQPIVRQSLRKYAEAYTTNGAELLDGPYRLPIARVPVFRCTGWEVFVGSKRERWGLVRFLKDPQRLHNYWRSIIAEKLMQTPKAEWLASDKAVEGREQDFRDSAQSDDPLLIYNAEAATPPQRVQPAQLDAALIQEAGMASQDIRDVSNLHEASLGQQSNEVSGKAISARQRIGETGTAIYQDNLNAAIEECGMVINQLIPYVYDTVRQIRVLGEDDAEEIMEINGEGQDGQPGIDISEGKYAVTITTGPSYATKRIEAADSMLNMINAMPQTMAVAADKIVEAQDWPGSEEIARRLATQLPPGMVSEEDMTPEQKQAREQAGQLSQAQTKLQMEDAQADVEMKKAQAQDFLARAAQANAGAQKTMSEVGVNMSKAEADINSTELTDSLKIVEALQPTPDQGEK